jgi:hypothetical protein
MLKAMRTRTTIALATVGIVAVGAVPAASTALARHHHHHHHHHGIPQHNGGDHDADNNGAPSDGDGNV